MPESADTVCAITERLHDDTFSSVTCAVHVDLLCKSKNSVTVWHAASSIKSLHFVAALRCNVTHGVYCIPCCLLTTSARVDVSSLRVMQEVHFARAVLVVMSMLSICVFRACSNFYTAPLCPLSKTSLHACLSSHFHQKWAVVWTCTFLCIPRSFGLQHSPQLVAGRTCLIAPSYKCDVCIQHALIIALGSAIVI